MLQENLSCGVDEVAILDSAENATDFDEAQSDIQPPAIAADEGSAQPNHDGSEAYLTTVFNHEARQFDRSEAEQLVQMGLYSKPHIDRLKYLARLSGEQGVKQLLNRLIADGEQKLANDISGKVTDPALAKKITDDELSKLREALPDDDLNRSVEESKEGINRRLAEEFLELQSEFPQIDEFGALPQWVKECSAKDGVPLKYAYALHACRQQAKISAAEAHQQAAAKATAHSLKSVASDGTSPEMASVYKALWGQY